VILKSQLLDQLLEFCRPGGGVIPALEKVIADDGAVCSPLLGMFYITILSHRI
jgi:hypothetical protein